MGVGTVMIVEGMVAGGGRLIIFLLLIAVGHFQRLVLLRVLIKFRPESL